MAGRKRNDPLERTIDDIYRHPLRSTAADTLNRQLKAGISDELLAELAIALRADERLSLIQEEGEEHEPHILCSMGLFNPLVRAIVRYDSDPFSL